MQLRDWYADRLRAEICRLEALLNPPESGDKNLEHPGPDQTQVIVRSLNRAKADLQSILEQGT
jgi:hypothetical protein